MQRPEDVKKEEKRMIPFIGIVLPHVINEGSIGRDALGGNGRPLSLQHFVFDESQERQFSEKVLHRQHLAITFPGRND